MAPELRSVGDAFLFLAETPEPDEPLEVQAEKIRRNQRLFVDLQEKELQAGVHQAASRARREARLQQQAFRAWKQERRDGRLFRSAGWVVLLTGLLYLPEILANSEDLPRSWDFILVAGAWCLFGVVGFLEFFGGSFLAVLLLIVLPYWLLGPILLLCEDWFWGAASGPVPPAGERARSARKIQSSTPTAETTPCARELMEDDLAQYLKRSWHSESGDPSQRSWDIELDTEAPAGRDATRLRSK